MATISKQKRCRHLCTTGSVPSNRSGEQPSTTSSALTPGMLVPSTERFVGDLNPEAAIREKLDVTPDKQRRDRIGLWVNLQADASEAQLPEHSPAVESQSVASFLQRRCASVTSALERLPLSTRDRLIPLYFSKVNHILPLVDKHSFHAAGTASVFLERAMCLVAAKDHAAISQLRLAINGPLLASRDFCSEIYKGLVVVMNDGLESDRITRIRVLALMSLHCEGYEGAEAASMHLCQAIHQAQTVGLHLERPGRATWTRDLFWCLWTLDKMHASIGGRPVLLADRDISIEKPNAKNAFGIWLAIAELLSSVISFYRPTADHTVGWETGFPTFENMVSDNVGEDVDFATLGFLELFYHAVGILSCRYKPSDRPDSSNPSQVRQNHGASRIYTIAATECHQELPPLPIIPYALALSMGVSYQQARSSTLQFQEDDQGSCQSRVRELEACCSLLEDIGSCWYSAEAMARLGRKALLHLQDMCGRSSLTMPALQEPMSHEDTCIEAPPEPLGLDHSGSGEFADIDILFGDFLDLSLPTNFWDPVFFSDTQT